MTDAEGRTVSGTVSTTEKTGRISAFTSMLRWDVQLQIRYGFYAVYAVLTVVFVLGLRSLGTELRTGATVLLIVTEPTLLGFYFIAALVLFEKREGVLDALVVSPLGDSGYLASKVCSLSLLAVVAATLVAVFGHGVTHRLWVLVLGVSLSAPLFVLIGFVAVARFDSINQYFIGAVGWGTILFLPLFGSVGLIETRLFYLLPAQPVLLLVEGGFRPLTLPELGYGLGYLLLGNAAAYTWARRSFHNHVVRGGRAGRADRAGQTLRATFVRGSERRATTGVFERAKRRMRRWGAVRSPVLGMVGADLRNWARDPMLAIAAVGPLVLAATIRIGAPRVTELAAPVIALEPYYPVVAASMAVFGPTIYGFVVGMFVLEDREQGVLLAFRTTPLSDREYLVYRSLTAYVLSFVATLPALAVIGVESVGPSVLLGTAAVGALGGPVIALAFASLASHSIEGLALSKLVNVVVFAPAVVVAVVSPPAQFVAGVVPFFWPIKAYVAGAAGATRWPLYVLVGSVVHLLVVVILARTFARRID